MFVIALLIIISTLSSEAACLPDSIGNNLLVTTAEIQMIEDSVDRFEMVTLHKLPTDHEVAIRLEPLNPRVNAEVVKENGQVAIVVWGGMITHPKMTPNTFYLLLCHELGHFLGGTPLCNANVFAKNASPAFPVMFVIKWPKYLLYKSD